MSRTLACRLLACCLLPLANAAPGLLAGPANEAIVGRMSAVERLQLDHLRALDPQVLRGISGRIGEGRLRARAAELERLGVLAVGSRPVDAGGRAPIHSYLLAEYERLRPHGLELVGSFRGRVAAPVSLDRLLDPARREQPAHLRVGEERLPLHPLWPNGPMPALAPREGLAGPLVWCGSGRLEELQGLALDGAIALLEFTGAGNLERLFSLGAAAVIVLEDAFVQYQNAALLFSNTPCPFPRFYAAADVRRRLRELTASGRTGPRVELHGGQIFEERPVESFFFRLPAARTTEFVVPDDLPLRWLAATHGVNPAQLAEFNGVSGVPLRPGQVLRVMDTGRVAAVPEDGAWEMVARLHDIDAAALRAANPELAARPLEAGMRVAVPAADAPLGIFVPIDTASVVPDLPHGAGAIANIALALELMDHLCRQPGLRLRRDVVFGFIDGDTLGGQGSRLIAESTFLLDGQFRSRMAGNEDPDAVLARYRAGMHWFETGREPGEAALRRWLLEQWLRPRFEERRIALAEQRIARLVGARGSELLPPLEVLEADLARVAGLRDRTVMAGGSDTDRLRLLDAAWRGDLAAELQRFGLGREALRERFARELAEEELLRETAAHNRVAAARLRAATGGRTLGAPRLALAWRLDLGDSSPHVGLNLTADANLHLRRALLGSGFAQTLGPRLRRVAAYAASRAGWPEDHTFIAEEDRADLPLVSGPQTVTYDDFWVSADYMVLPLSGESDRRERVDTPADTLDRVDWRHFELQARTAMTLIGSGLESVLDTQVLARKRQQELSRISGRTVRFNIRSGIDARDPVPGTYVFLPMTSGAGGYSAVNASVFYGHRIGIVQIARLNGSFTMPVEVATYNPRPRIYAYLLDRDEALFRKVATQGQVGTKPQLNEFKYRAGEMVEKNLVMIDVYPRVVFAGVNPADLKPVLGNAYGPRAVDLVNAVIGGAPRDFAVDNPMVDFRERDREAVTLYLRPGDRVRAFVRAGLEYNFLLTGPLDAAEGVKAKGQGILVGPDPATGARNVLLALTPYHVAKGMWRVADNRLRLYREYGITSRGLQEAVDRAGAFLAEAETAASGRDWQVAIGASREAWGILVKNFPRILQLGREAVFSVILLMALAIPGAWFLERLVIGSKGIVARLAGIAAIFIAGTLFLNGFHPAFRIALSPFIIVIAFTMILMSVIVLALAYARFDVVLRRFRSSSGEVQSQEISFMSSLATAFSLGVSNLKKRAFRTALTVFTVTALTFSIVGFVAVSGTDTLTRHPLPLDNMVEGHPVEPLPPAYDGLLIRGHNWRTVEAGVVAALQAEFGGRHEVTVRAHYMQVEGGNQANREGVNQLPVRYAGREHVLNAVAAFQPNEPLFSGLHRAVSGGAWFRAGDPERGVPEDRMAVILPDTAAAALGIRADMLVDAAGNRLPDQRLPEVQLLNLRWRVIGILDTALANRIRDVNGRSLAVVDYLRSGMSTSTSPGEIVNEGRSYHMDWARLAIVPYAARHDIGATPRSVAIRVAPSADARALFSDLALRLKTEFFAAHAGAVAMVVPRAKVDLAGVAKILLPVLLCVLIVMNTMLGTVEERKGEVGMLGAIGLSPRQIAFLMFAESTVFSILGILLGTFGGLLFANIVNAINAAGGDFLTSLSFNFTSLLSMALATGTGLVVLLATLIPAGKAAALAAPSGMSEWELPESEEDGVIAFRLPFTLTRGNAVGMAAFFHQFLVNHNEPTSEDFNCRAVALTTGGSGGRPFIELRTDMWLAPYDLDVAQHFTLRLQAGARESVFEVDLRLVRFSGSEENSRRTAYCLLNLVRRQFLLWRNLGPQRRAEFIQQGARLLEGAAPQPRSP